MREVSLKKLYADKKNYVIKFVVNPKSVQKRIISIGCFWLGHRVQIDFGYQKNKYGQIEK